MRNSFYYMNTEVLPMINTSNIKSHKANKTSHKFNLFNDSRKIVLELSYDNPLKTDRESLHQNTFPSVKNKSNFVVAEPEHK